MNNFQVCVFYVIINLGYVIGQQYILNAVLLGHRGSIQENIYREVDAALAAEENGGDANYCAINFMTIEYDTRNGSTVYNSLQNARRTFSNDKMAVAIGPFIEVFTSPSYVIQRQEHLLTSSAAPAATNQVSSNLYPILPDLHSFSQAIADVVKKLRWYKVALLSQDDFSPVLSLERYNIDTWPVRLPARISSPFDKELQQILISLREAQIDKIILHSMDKEVIKNVIAAAKRLHLVYHRLEWFLTYLDFKDTLDTGEKSWPGTLRGFQLLRPDKIPQSLYDFNITRLDLGLIVDVVRIVRQNLQLNVESCYDRPPADEVIRSDEFGYTLKRESSQFNGSLGQYAWNATLGNSRTNYIFEIVQYRDKLETIGEVLFKNGKPHIQHFIETGDGATSSEVFGKDETIYVVARLDEPFVMLKGDKFSGFSVDILGEISEKLGFSYKIFMSEKGQAHGREHIWDDMVKQLRSGNASLAIGAIPVTAEREEVISFSYTILSTAASILVKTPPNTRNFFQFLWPFSADLWFVILAFVLVIGLTLFIMFKFDPTQQESLQKFDLKESMWYSVNVLLQGGTEYSPQTTATRTVIAFYWFCILIINAAYTANLAAFLTIRQIDTAIRSVQDLVGRSDIIQYGVMKDSIVEDFFQNARRDPYERMWSVMKMREDELILNNMTQVVNRVLDGRFVFMADGIVNEFYASQHCGMESIEQDFGYKHFSIGLPKGAPYKDDVNRALLELKENGRLDILRAKWWSQKECGITRKTSAINQKTAELSLDNMFGVFMVLAGSVFLASVTEAVNRINNACKECRAKMKAKKKDVKSETQAVCEPLTGDVDV